MATPTLKSLRRRPEGQEHDGEQPSSQPGSQVQRRSLLRTAGRGLLWFFIALVLLRGLSATFSDDAPQGAARPAPSADERFPDPEARAFAGQFAQEYLAFEPGKEESYARRIAPYLSRGARDNAELQLPDRGATQFVDDLSIARVEKVGGSQALITLAVDITRVTPAQTKRVGKGRRRRIRTIPSRRTTSTSYLAVPVYEDKSGGLAVYDLPAFTSPPARATDFSQETAQLQGSSQDTGAINDLVRKFLPVYLAGRPDQLAFYVPPGTRITPLGQDLKVTRVVQVEQVGDDEGRDRKLLVQALVRDPSTRATYPMSYRLDVLRRDRWLVKRVEGGGGP